MWPTGEKLGLHEVYGIHSRSSGECEKVQSAIEKYHEFSSSMSNSRAEYMHNFGKNIGHI